MKFKRQVENGAYPWIAEDCNSERFIPLPSFLLSGTPAKVF
jgi:hypothetical protein